VSKTHDHHHLNKFVCVDNEVESMGNNHARDPPRAAQPTQAGGQQALAQPAQNPPLPLVPAHPDLALQEGIKWDESVIGQEDAKRALEYSFFLPRRFPTFFYGKNKDAEKKNLKHHRSIMLWGPPGTFLS
jgi:hypothetical protein